MSIEPTPQELQDRFSQEQDYIRKYVELLQSKTAILDSEVRQVSNIMSRYGLASIEIRRDWSLRGKPYSLEELELVVGRANEIDDALGRALEESRAELARTDQPEDLASVDARSQRGEWIQYFIDALGGDLSLGNLETQRNEAIEHERQMKEELAEEYEPFNDADLDYAIQSAAYILRSRKLYDLEYVRDKLVELDIALRTARPEAEINILRQGFILLMTVFDAVVFDLVKVALRTDFFGLIVAFGKQDKISVASLAKHTSLEEFRDELIEERLKAKYLKDLLFILQTLGVPCVDQARGDRFVQLVELVLRRNVHIHNRGRVDEKYLERDRNGAPRYNIYNLQPASVAQIDFEYWERANRLCRNCVLQLVKWVESLP